MIRLVGSSSQLQQFISPPFTWPNNTGGSADSFFFNHNFGHRNYHTQVFDNNLVNGTYRLVHVDWNRDLGNDNFGFIAYHDPNTVQLNCYRNVFGSARQYFVVCTELSKTEI